LCPFACGFTVADSPLFFGLNRRDQRLVFAQALPGIFIEIESFLDLSFGQQAVGKSRHG